jgi:hypothetical protein
MLSPPEREEDGMRARIIMAAAIGGALFLAGGGAARSLVAPTNSVAPSISGTAVVGQTLTAANGTWAGTAPITYAHAWQRCNTSGQKCQAISGATESTFHLTNTDLGHTIIIVVTATNVDGKLAVNSLATKAVTTASGKPASTKPPKISGTATVGAVVSASTGTWSGDEPITYSYQWQSCDVNGNSCTNIGGETAASYTIPKAEAGKTLRVQVTATNSRGNAKAISTETSSITDTTGGGGGGGGGGNTKSVDVSTVVAGERLIVDKVVFSPNPVRSKSQPIRVTVTVKDTHGNLVRGAWVSIRSTPLVTNSGPDQLTADNGTVSFSLTPQSDFPIKAGYSVQFFVKAYRKGDDPLAGVSGTRLVQVATSP